MLRSMILFFSGCRWFWASVNIAKFWNVKAHFDGCVYIDSNKLIFWVSRHCSSGSRSVKILAFFANCSISVDLPAAMLPSI